MSRQLAGIVSLRAVEIERRRLLIVPGTTYEPCDRCGERVAMSPAMHRLRARRSTSPWCWECVVEVNPRGVNLIATRGIILEALLLDRLSRGMSSGPVH